MPSGVRDIQLLELKDTISQLNNTISTQNELIRSLQKMLQERDAKDSERINGSLTFRHSWTT